MLYSTYRLFFPPFFHSEDKGLKKELEDLIHLQFCIKIQRGQRSSFFLLHFGSFGIFL